MDIKFPSNQAEMDALRKNLVQEIDDDDLEAVAGGNDDLKGKGNGTPFTCPGCGSTFYIKQIQDAAKHIVKCPGNPYK